MKIGLLGGSFNPPHQGHVYISLEAKKRARLNQIWWLPTKQNPFKKQADDFTTRFLKCRQITKKHRQILVKSDENRITSHYSFDLLNLITRRYSKHQFYWLIGADNLMKFHLWQNWRRIIQLMPIIICNRDNLFHKAVRSKSFLYAKKLNHGYFLKIKPCSISSTQLRKTKCP